MALTPGTRLGVYTITAQIGEGGMGQVYRARDTTLNRDVALKVLPDSFANDPDRLARFTREARTLASLNHLNITHIHGIEESGGVRALVMELVEGDDLSQRITRGAIPIDEVLPIATQIADALEAAHGQGIVHRDLKPANIKVRPDGTVKVLDFGLAKAMDPAVGSSPSPSMSPTITSPAMTRAGTIFGTAAYMSPEQARGKTVDKRADIWAFGVVLFEMLTGRRAFVGDDVSDTIASVLKIEPDWQLLPAETPALIRRLLRRCLVKERRDRLADISDARLDLVEAIASPGGAAGNSTGKSARLPWSVAIVLATVLMAGLAAVAIFFARAAPGASSAFHSTITFPADVGVFATGPPLALSPDGRYLAFTAADASGGKMLWIRRLDRPTAQPLSGTEGANAPFWSADSRLVAFVADGSLKKIDLLGGPAVTVAASAFPLPGSWNRDDIILFSSSETQISRIPAAGGTASLATTVDVQAGHRGHSFPFFLPDGRSFLYLVDAGSGGPDLYVGALDSAERTLLLEDVSNAQYGAEILLFLKGATLMARPFDAGRRTFTGDAEPLADQIQLSTLSLTSGTWRAGAYSVSGTSTLVYLRSASADSQLVWFDRSGDRLGVLGDPASYADVILSPDGQRASISILDPGGTGTRDIWAYDVARGIRNRVTFDAGDEFEGVWSPDNSRIVFNSTRRGGRDLYWKTAAAGAGAEEALLQGGPEKYAQGWSPDGKSLLYITTGAQQDIWVLPLTGDRTPWPYLATPFSEGVGARFSPDGNWISYTSNESGRQQAYIARFPNHGGRVQVSTNGGLAVTWREDGREAYYYEPASRGGGGRLMAVDLTYDASGVSASTPRPLATVVPGGPRSFYDAMPDGQRFLVNSVLDRMTATPITLVVNWPALLGSAR